MGRQLPLTSIELSPEPTATVSMLHAKITQSATVVDTGSCSTREVGARSRPRSYRRMRHELAIVNMGPKQKLQVEYTVDSSSAYLCSSHDKGQCFGGTKPSSTKHYPVEDAYWEFHKKVFVQYISWEPQPDNIDCNLTVKITSTFERRNQSSSDSRLLITYMQASET